MELNRRYNCFDVLKVTEKKLPFSGGLTEYFPPNPQLVNKQCYLLQKKIDYDEKIGHFSHEILKMFSQGEKFSTSGIESY